MAVSNETVKTVQQSIMRHAIASDAVLGGFSALNAMHVPDARGNLPYIKVIALHAPYGVAPEAFVKELLSHGITEAFFQSGEKLVAKPPQRSAFWTLRVVPGKSEEQARDVATIAPFPSLPFLPEDVTLEDITWTLRVSVGGLKWTPRALLPSVFRQVLQNSNSGRVLAALDTFDAEGQLLQPPEVQETAIQARWIEYDDNEAAPAAPLVPTTILRRQIPGVSNDAYADAYLSSSSSVTGPPPAAAAGSSGSITFPPIVFPTAADTASAGVVATGGTVSAAPPALKAAIDTDTLYSGLQAAAMQGWNAVEKLATLLIAYPTFPRIQFTTPDINVVALNELQAAAHTAYSSAPNDATKLRPLEAYMFAATTTPHGRYGWWAFLNVLFALPTGGPVRGGAGSA